MLLKHIYMGWKFQRTLKLDISFSLEHFFMSAAILPQLPQRLQMALSSNKMLNNNHPLISIAPPKTFLVLVRQKVIIKSVWHIFKYQIWSNTIYIYIYTYIYMYIYIYIYIFVPTYDVEIYIENFLSIYLPIFV